MDEEGIRKTLQSWASSQQLSSATLTEEGIRLGDTVLPATTQLTVQHGDKSCQYTTASIFLQLLDPNQSLVAYRNACKKHNVTDPIKALDKPIILGFFLGVSTGLASEAADSAAAPPIEAAEERHSEKEAARHVKKKEHKKHSSKRKSIDGKHKPSSPAKKLKKTPKELVSNEKLLHNLNVVVDKRQVSADQQQVITLALSAEGFEVTPELLEQHKQQAQAILSREIPVGNSASILRAVNPRKDLSRVLELFQQATNPTTSSKSTSSSRHANKHGTPTTRQVRKHLIGKKPIIIVPKGMTAAITLVNAHEFLSKARFVPRDVLVQQGRHRSAPTTFTRTVRGNSGNTALLEYEIMDNPRKLSAMEWDRVVAVICLGHAWQFKDWLPLYNQPATLFEKVYGYYAGMEGDKLPPEVSGWAVHRATLNRDKRGLDQVAYASFWNGLDEWMRVHKPELLPQTET